MMTIIVGSTNPVKITAVKTGFESIFPNEIFTIEGAAAVSGVQDQPMTNNETLQGALNRVSYVKGLKPEADFWVGIEGGVEKTDHGMEAFAWIVIKNKHGEIGKGRTGTFFLPKAVEVLINEGKELGDADSMVFGRANAKQKNGTVGFLTNNTIDRAAYYTHAVILALIPFGNKTWYNEDTPS